MLNSAAAFNRRMRKTARPVVWEDDGAQPPSLDPIVSRLSYWIELSYKLEFYQLELLAEFLSYQLAFPALRYQLALLAWVPA
jgi:hypothetical protein